MAFTPMGPKEARNRSSDPVQEQLRTAKDSWNKDVSLLIAELIAFKRGLNGRGDKNLNIPPSSIKDPLPPQVQSILNNIATQSNKVQDGARSIIDEQSRYSQVRRQKHSSFEDSLVAQGSWWGSRMWAYVALLRKIEKAERGLRHRLLSSLAACQKEFRKVEDKILKRGDLDSIPDAFTLWVNTLTLMQNNVLQPIADLHQIFQAKQEAAESKAKEIATQAPKPSEPGGKETLENAEIPSPQIPSGPNELDLIFAKTEEYFQRIYPLLEGAVSRENGEDSHLLKEAFQIFVKHMFFILQKKNVAGNELPDLQELETSFSILQNGLSTCLKILTRKFPELENNPNNLSLLKIAFSKESDNSLRRWFNKSLLSVQPSEYDKVKIDLLNSLERADQSIEELMNALEDPDKTYPSFQVHISSLFKDILSALGVMEILAHHYQNDLQRQRKLKGEKFRDIRSEDLNKLKTLKNVFQLFLSHHGV